MCIAIAEVMKFLTQKTVYRLNSKRIKLAQIHQLAQALELPVTASSPNLPIMVQERLRKLERVPENVQLVIEEIPDGSENLQLQDERGYSMKMRPQNTLRLQLLLKYRNLVFY